ncbi:MAG TPA: ribosome recycling factor [Planctomycetia bacterium]|jgi:ribosome recycling factor|nr:ribosome recycling factor [Planctomycetia bacterium]
MDRDEILLDAEERMEKAVDSLKSKLVGLRTGRASPGLVENMRVDYYGTPTPLKQMANISAPEAQLLVIRPFDASALKEIEKAIRSSDLGLAPMSDGKVVRINVPSLSGDQRKKLVAKAKEFAEEQRVAIRNVRRDANKHAETLEKDGGCSEDDLAAIKDEVQELTKKYEAAANDMTEKKSKEIMD